MADYVDWSDLEYQLKADADKFIAAFGDTSNSKAFEMTKVKFSNKFGVEQMEEEGWFRFEYEIGWKFHSNEPKCFAGDHLEKANPSCNFWCAEEQCRLKMPADPNNEVTGTTRRDL